MPKHTLPSFLESRWVLLIVLLVFVCFKIPQLHYPFYVDEGWVYAPAVKTMAINGPSLLPGSISADYSRGHPLMFHFLSAVWIRCFGSSNIAIHSFPLLLSVIFLIALYECCRRLFGSKEAMLVLLLVATRVIFFVQSSFVYPEVMVAMLAFLSLYFYARDRLLLTSLMLFILFFTKEGALIFGVVIGADATVSLFRGQDSMQRRLLRIAVVLTPTCLIGLFFVLQKAKFGWYMLPEHTGMITTSWKAYYLTFRQGLYWAYRGDSAMCVLAVFIILLSIVPAVRLKNACYLFLCPAAALVYILAEMSPVNASGGLLWMLLYLLFFTIPVWCVLELNKTMGAPARKFIILLAIGVLAFLFYSSLTVIGYRYLLVNIILLLVFLAICISTFVAAGGKNLFYIAIAGIIGIGIYGFFSNERYEDTQLGAFQVMNVELGELSYLEKENAYDKEIAFGCTWEGLRFTDTLQGFLSSNRIFTHMKRFPVGPQAQYAVFSDCSDNQDDYNLMRSNPNFHLAYEIKDGKIWAAIYKRN
jgi:hypothetical protein